MDVVPHISPVILDCVEDSPVVRGDEFFELRIAQRPWRITAYHLILPQCGTDKERIIPRTAWLRRVLEHNSNPPRFPACAARPGELQREPRAHPTPPPES